MPDYESIELLVEDGLCQIVLNQPEKGNAFDATFIREFSRARRFLLLGETLAAEDALAGGLVDHVVDDERIADEAYQAALALSHGPTRAYGEIRHLMARALGTGFEAQLEDEVSALVRAAGTADAREGISAFVEKRQPHFQGR